MSSTLQYPVNALQYLVSSTLKVPYKSHVRTRQRHNTRILRWGAAHCRVFPATSYRDCHTHPKECHVRDDVRSTV